MNPPNEQAAPEGAARNHRLASDSRQDTTDGAIADTLAAVEAIRTGRYVPAPGTVGAALLGRHPGCRCHAERSIATFARLGLRDEGIWWPLVLAADPESSTGEDADYVALAWSMWLRAESPFRRAR